MQPDKFNRRAKKIDEDAERVEKLIIAKLDLKQKHASLNEAHYNAVIRAAVLAFTVIALIFAPLSFIAKIFTLPVNSFSQDSGGSKIISTTYIGKWMGK